jgi:heme-degrading monooxygenase HmoA
MLTIPWATSKSIPEGSTLRQISRLELTRMRDVPGFLVAALRLRRIVMAAPGAAGVSLRAEPSRRTFWTLSAWQDQDALDAFTRSDYHRGVMVKYRRRMAGSHFHTWNEGNTTATRPEWDDAIRRYDASTTQP